MSKNTIFILIIFGTVGLLANEFIFDWGTTATLIFALANLIGLVGLGSGLAKKDQ